MPSSFAVITRIFHPFQLPCFDVRNTALPLPCPARPGRAVPRPAATNSVILCQIDDRQTLNATPQILTLHMGIALRCEDVGMPEKL